MKIRLKDVNQFNEILIKKGLTKSDLAEAIGLSVPRTIQISNGDRGPGTKAAKRITDILQMEWDSIFIIDHSVETPISN